MKRFLAMFLILALLCPLAAFAEDSAALADGIYYAKFDTDSSMFHVNEACEGKGILTVKDGVMTIHVTLASKSILNLYPGLKADAEKEGAVLLEPSVDKVIYSDGFADTAYGFDVPVPYLDAEFDLALIGKKGKWYDHKVSVSEVEPFTVADGEYQIDVDFAGGSGKSTVLSPATLIVADGVMTARIVWSSSKYDYMLVDGVRYDVITTEGGSTFEIPVAALNTALDVVGDTVAMGTPHEIEYTLTFLAHTICAVEEAA